MVGKRCKARRLVVNETKMFRSKAGEERQT